MNNPPSCTVYFAIVTIYTFSNCSKINIEVLPPNRSEENRIHSLVRIFAEHIRLHGIHALRKESVQDPISFCSRKFVNGRQAGCGNFGNSVYQYFSGFLYSVILNRTFFVVDSISCENSTLFTRPWIPTYSDITSLYKASKCDETRLGDPRGFYVLPQFYNSSYIVGSSFDYSCFMDRVDSLNLAFFHSELIPYKIFYDKENLALGDSAKAKVLAIFSNTVEHDAFFESMGFAFHFTIGFSEEVHSVVHDLLSSLFPSGHGHSLGSGKYHEMNAELDNSGGTSMTPDSAATERQLKSIQRLCVSYPPNTITIAMHVRHFNKESRSNPALDIELDRNFTIRLKEVLTEKFNGLHCRLLLASDRRESILRLRSDATALGCDVLTVPRGDLNRTENITDCFMENKWNGLCLEQGPWRKGAMQMADLVFLSHAQYFIGTGTSTYSNTIAYLLSLRRAACYNNWMPSPIDYVSGAKEWRNMTFYLLHSNPLIVPCPAEAVKRLSLS